MQRYPSQRLLETRTQGDIFFSLELRRIHPDPSLGPTER